MEKKKSRMEYRNSSAGFEQSKLRVESDNLIVKNRKNSQNISKHSRFLSSGGKISVSTPKTRPKFESSKLDISINNPNYPPLKKKKGISILPPLDDSPPLKLPIPKYLSNKDMLSQSFDPSTHLGRLSKDILNKTQDLSVPKTPRSRFLKLRDSKMIGHRVYQTRRNARNSF